MRLEILEIRLIRPAGAGRRCGFPRRNGVDRDRPGLDRFAGREMTEFEREFNDWLGRICRTEKPSPAVAAYNIGLFETGDGYSAYLVGANNYSEDDSDWACDVSFTPRERYF